MDSNRTLLQKADLALADLTSGGELRPAQADQFIRLAIKEAVFLKMVDVTPMKAQQEDRDKIRFSGRVLKPGTEATALPLAQRSKPALSRVTLTARLFRGEVRMSEEVLEDQIERGAFQQTILETMAAAVARDMETVVINGDTASADVLLAVLDGVLKQATSNTVNAGTVRLSKTILRDTLKALDDEFSKVANLQYWTNRQAAIDYHDAVADRATGLGDANLANNAVDKYNGIPITPVYEFPPTTETGGTNTQLLLTTGANIMVGVHRQIRVASQHDAPAGVLIFVPTLRFDTKIIEVAAAARAFNVVGT